MNARQIRRLENKKRKLDYLERLKSIEIDKPIKRSHEEIKEIVERKKLKLHLYLKHQGDSALIHETSLHHERIPLFISDIRELIVYLLYYKATPPYCEPRWCNQSNVSCKYYNVVLIINEGISLNQYLINSEQLPVLRDKFIKFEIVPPSCYDTNIVEEFVMSSRNIEAQDIKKENENSGIESEEDTISQNECHNTMKSAFPVEHKIEANQNIESTNKLNKEYDMNNTEVSDIKSTDLESTTKTMTDCSNVSKTNISNLPINDMFPRTLLLLSALQMVEEDYPILLRGELSSKYSSYVMTKDVYSEVTPFSPLFALDCEMCKTGEDTFELTRITVVDEQENVVYESLVKPYNKITNYLTHYSGITKALLKDVETRLEDVQRDLRKILPPDAILVGQSLNMDLNVLKMMHPYVIDTSVIFNTSGQRSCKAKLKLLANHFLNMVIQDQSTGHDSKEDSIAALRLVKLKLSKDPQFGDTIALQKCIRNINSNLSTVNQVQNLFSYFDHIALKQKGIDMKMRKTASVITTSSNKEKLYEKYLKKYRTSCTLIKPQLINEDDEEIKVLDTKQSTDNDDVTIIKSIEPKNNNNIEIIDNNPIKNTSEIKESYEQCIELHNGNIKKSAIKCNISHSEEVNEIQNDVIIDKKSIVNHRNVNANEIKITSLNSNIDETNPSLNCNNNVTNSNLNDLFINEINKNISQFKNFILGHTLEKDYKTFNDIIDRIESKFNQRNEVVVVLCVPDSSEIVDKSSGVCFISANC